MHRRVGEKVIFHKGIIFFDMGKIEENHIGSMDFSVYMEGVSVIL